MSFWRRWLGQQGEDVAARFLRRQRYAIVERNFRCAQGEIDIIAVERAVIVFVEVKTRRHGAFGDPVEAVDRRKRQRILRVAETYLARHALEDRDARFDIVEVWWSADGPRCHLIRDAFRGDD